MTKKEILRLKYDNATTAKSWLSLIAYPQLLCSWQNVHPDDQIKVATVSSHIAGYTCVATCSRQRGIHNHHIWCKDKCDIIESFIKK